MSDLSAEDVERHFSQLAELEKEFDQVDVEILRETTLKQKQLYERRDAITNAIPGFWPHVVEDSSSSLGFDEQITPEDAELLSSLVEVKVTRPNAEKGDPRDLEIKFSFVDNEYMPAQSLIKRFTYQSTSVTQTTGLVSTPTEIIWKDGKDLTFGVNKAAIEAFEERKEGAAKGKGRAAIGKKQKKLSDLLSQQPPSFFGWFSYTGTHEELGEAEDTVDEDVAVVGPVEAYPHGDEIAIQFAQDVYPSAVKYFTSSLEEEDEDDEDDNDISLGSGSDSEDDDLKDSHSGCGTKNKHSHSHSHDDNEEPAKKKAKK